MNADAHSAHGPISSYAQPTNKDADSLAIPILQNMHHHIYVLTMAARYAKHDTRGSNGKQRWDLREQGIYALGWAW